MATNEASSSRTVHTLQTTKAESQANQTCADYKRIMCNNNIYMPTRYILYMIRNGSIDDYIKTIENTNRELAERQGKSRVNSDNHQNNPKRKETSLRSDASEKKIKTECIPTTTTDMSTQTADLSPPRYIHYKSFDEEDKIPGRTYIYKSFYDSD